MIVFENSGEIDPRCITTMGLHVKEGESPIGFFGTGLKYALAVLLRENQRVEVQSGLVSYQFDTQAAMVRGKEFSFIRMASVEWRETEPDLFEPVSHTNPQELGFTTELGKNWSLREAYRELHCNAVDEGSSGGFETFDPPVPLRGTTRVIVEGSSFTHWHHSRSTFLLDPAAHPLLQSDSEIEVRLGRNKAVFFRGVKVFEGEKEFAYTYNILAQLSLTEDRTAPAWQVEGAVRRFLAGEDAIPALVKDAIATESVVEQETNFNYTVISPQFARTVRELLKSKPESLNKSAIEVYYKGEGGEPSYEPHRLTEVEQASLREAIAWCKRAGFPVDRFTIQVVQGLGERRLGLARNGIIFLVPQAFERGLLRELLIEEYVHLAHGVPDCSREMQNVLFGHIVRLAAFGQKGEE